jgi:hypothetical protein
LARLQQAVVTVQANDHTVLRPDRSSCGHTGHVNNPGVAAAVNEDIRLGAAYADELHKCEAAAAQAGKEQRCALSVPPSPLRVNGQPVGR